MVVDDDMPLRAPGQSAEGRLPALRMDLDFQPSPSESQPGLLIRDSFRFSDTTLIVPPYLLRYLPFFDGEHSREELIHELAKSATRANAEQLEAHLRETLAEAGFLNDAHFAAIKKAALDGFAASPVRKAAHAGAAYPHDRASLKAYLAGNLAEHACAASPVAERLLGIAAPHISFEGGWRSYAAAAAALEAADPESLFVVMGTSHYGTLDRLGITTKQFETPLGVTRAEPELVREFAAAAPDAVVLEDYCHAVDHSLEFHVLLLQHLVRPDVRVLPVLVGAFAQVMQPGCRPEDDEALARAFGALREIAQARGRNLFWMMSVDMAHMGRRYGDHFPAEAFAGRMEEVQELDRDRVLMLARGDSGAFWADVTRRDADLKWCGSSTLYAFTQVYPEVRAELLQYEQWNIDPESVVSFGSLAFHRG